MLKLKQLSILLTISALLVLGVFTVRHLSRANEGLLPPEEIPEIIPSPNSDTESRDTDISEAIETPVNSQHENTHPPPYNTRNPNVTNQSETPTETETDLPGNQDLDDNGDLLPPFEFPRSVREVYQNDITASADEHERTETDE